MKSPQRFAIIDVLRGAAVIGMIVYHWFFILDYFGAAQIAITQGLWLLLARGVQFIFLGLVGISLALSRYRSVGSVKIFYKKQLGRLLFIVGSAVLVTLATALFIFVGEQRKSQQNMCSYWL